VLEAHCGVKLGGYDVYLNVAGGLRIQEPAADLAAAAALVSSLVNAPLPTDAVYFGEISLSGAVRPVAQTSARLKEAAKLGFGRAVLPESARGEVGGDAGLSLNTVGGLTSLVAEIADSFDFHALDAVLRKKYLSRSWPPTPGDYHHWAETWALESVKAANDAYAAIQFNSYETMGDPNSLWISITLPSGYAEQNAPRAAEQLTEAAVRLAQLLDQLHWP